MGIVQKVPRGAIILSEIVGVIGLIAVLAFIYLMYRYE